MVPVSCKIVIKYKHILNNCNGIVSKQKYIEIDNIFYE